jgi:malate dehydrogenase
MSGSRKVTVIGANGAGTDCARRLAARGDLNVVLVDPEPGLARSRAQDINSACVIAGGEARVQGADSYEASAGSAVCVVAESPASEPGLEHADAVIRCREVVSSATRQLVRSAPDAVLVVISAPQEVGCHCALASSGFPRGRVIGIGGLQVAARARMAIAAELGGSPADVQLTVMGSSGEGGRVLGPASIGGVPVLSLVGEARLRELWNAQVGPQAPQRRDAEPLSAASAAAEIVDACLADSGRLLCCAAFCRGEYGVDSAFVAVPCRLGPEGIEEIVELPLPEADLERLQAAGAAVRAMARAAR